MKDAETERRQQRSKLREAGYILDLDKIANVVDILLKVKGPMAVLFSGNEFNQIQIEIFVGGHFPVLKMVFDEESVTEGKLGHLMSSQEVTKIIPSQGQPWLSSALKLLVRLGYKPNGFYDIILAFKMLDYLECGQTIYRIRSPRLSELFLCMNLNPASTFDSMLTAYLYFQEVLPPFAVDYMAARNRNEMDIGSNTDLPQARACRKLLKETYEKKCVHVTSKKASKQLGKFLRSALEDQDIKVFKVWVYKKHAIVSLEGNLRTIIPQAVSCLNSEPVQTQMPMDVAIIDADPKPSTNKVSQPLHKSKLDQQMVPHLENLMDLGLSNLLPQHSLEDRDK